MPEVWMSVSGAVFMEWMSVWICERVTVGSDRARSLGWAWCLLLSRQDGTDLMSTFFCEMMCVQSPMVLNFLGRACWKVSQILHWVDHSWHVDAELSLFCYSDKCFLKKMISYASVAYQVRACYFFCTLWNVLVQVTLPWWLLWLLKGLSVGMGQLSQLQEGMRRHGDAWLQRCLRSLKKQELTAIAERLDIVFAGEVVKNDLISALLTKILWSWPCARMKWRCKGLPKIGPAILNNMESSTSTATWKTSHWSRCTVGLNEFLLWWILAWNNGKWCVARCGNGPWKRWPTENPCVCFSIALEASIAALAFCVPGLSWVTTFLPRMPSSCCWRSDLPCDLGAIAPMSWRLCGNWKAYVLSGKGILARPIETNFRRPSSVESVRDECATMKKHETNFRRPSPVESVRDECATMKKQELAAPLNVIQFDGFWSKCKTSVQQSWDIELVSTISLAFALLATPALRLALLRRDVSQWFLEMKFETLRHGGK